MQKPAKKALSLPLRKCGLKFSDKPLSFSPVLSLPLRKCGLKCMCHNHIHSIFSSLPLRKCGLKWCGDGAWAVWNRVTSLAEVWIEMTMLQLARSGLKSHFPCGSVDWNHLCKEDYQEIKQSLPLRKCGLKFDGKILKMLPGQSLPLRKCGLKSLSYVWELYAGVSLPLRKCGLKSSRTELLRQVGLVTSLAEVWIEIYMKEKLWSTPWSLPLRKCGLKSPLLMCWVISVLVTSLAEVWIEIYALTL